MKLKDKNTPLLWEWMRVELQYWTNWVKLAKFKKEIQSRPETTDLRKVDYWYSLYFGLINAYFFSNGWKKNQIIS